MVKQQHNQVLEETPDRPRHVRPEVYDNAYRYHGSVGRSLFALDMLVIKMYQEELRQRQAASVGERAVVAGIRAQAEEQRERVGESVAPAAIAETDLAAQVEAAGGVENAAVDMIAEAQHAVDEALRGATVAPQPDQRSFGLAS